ncbi:NERD domain-containing protein [Viridibacillus sp. YIM B01967]|uniref:NERD domain-containing protein n=2 Tax=Viridibacillus soli TaxID=2798301 RepID=A0ABS1H824_9BACL|nr:NERD domain-containing protein [Viridibacillus soli]
MEQLKHLKLPYEFYIFHNLNLFIESNIQIDILIITPHYIMIFEVKNIKGTIEFRQNPSQLVRTLNTGETHTFNSPESQLQEYVYQIQQLSQEIGFKIPVYGAIVFSFASSYIKEPTTKTKVLLRNEIRSFLREVKVSQRILSSEELGDLSRFLLVKHHDFNPYPLCKYYDIHPSDLKSGVECPLCDVIGMKRVYRNWFCPNCGAQNNVSHEQALRDYAILISSTITNKECRSFLNLADRNQAFRILTAFNKTGTYRNAKYELIKQPIRK